MFPRICIRLGQAQKGSKILQIKVPETLILKAPCAFLPFVITNSFVCRFVFHCAGAEDVSDLVPWQLSLKREGSCCCSIQVKGRERHTSADLQLKSKTDSSAEELKEKQIRAKNAAQCENS